MSLRVVVLGCGPAGLVAAHAAVCMNADVRILSKPRKSFMRGAQYLHAPIPLMGDQTPFDINYQLVGGTAADYRDKVYRAARVSDEDVSVASLKGIHPGWDIRSAYDDLWETYGDYVLNWEATPAALSQIIGEWSPDLVISSVPANLLCDQPDRHSFHTQFIWSTDQAMHINTYNDDGVGDNTVVCNAADGPSWYRSALIHGWGTTEWPEHRKPPLNSSKLWNVPKPVGTDCDCFQGRVLRVGRYGSWTKGTLVHQIFEEVLEECTAAEQRLW